MHGGRNNAKDEQVFNKLRFVAIHSSTCSPTEYIFYASALSMKADLACGELRVLLKRQVRR